MYTCFGLSTILFISHSIFLYGFAVQKRRLSIEWMALMGFLNIAGAAVYASRLCIFFLEMLFLIGV
jgi:adiponectin receptor